MSPRFAVIVAHGSPSDPGPVDAAVKALAARAGAMAGGLHVAGATLAEPGALAAALGDAGGEPVAIYPFFMSNGWFVRSELRRRVAAIARGQVRYLEPFGLDPALPDLCIRIAAAPLTRRGVSPAGTVLVLAAHGSASNGAPAEAARNIAAQIAASHVFAQVRLGFVEEQPSITAAASGMAARPALCLPLFATTAGHVTGDVPRQLADAGFRGLLLPPVGDDDETAAMIARSLAGASAT